MNAFLRANLSLLSIHVSHILYPDHGPLVVKRYSCYESSINDHKKKCIQSTTQNHLKNHKSQNIQIPAKEKYPVEFCSLFGIGLSKT